MKRVLVAIALSVFLIGCGGGSGGTTTGDNNDTANGGNSNGGGDEVDSGFFTLLPVSGDETIRDLSSLDDGVLLLTTALDETTFPATLNVYVRRVRPGGDVGIAQLGAGNVDNDEDRIRDNPTSFRRNGSRMRVSFPGASFVYDIDSNAVVDEAFEAAPNRFLTATSRLLREEGNVGVYVFDIGEGDEVHFTTPELRSTERPTTSIVDSALSEDGSYSAIILFGGERYFAYWNGATFTFTPADERLNSLQLTGLFKSGSTSIITGIERLDTTLVRLALIYREGELYETYNPASYPRRICEDTPSFQDIRYNVSIGGDSAVFYSSDLECEFDGIRGRRNFVTRYDLLDDTFRTNFYVLGGKTAASKTQQTVVDKNGVIYTVISGEKQWLPVWEADGTVRSVQSLTR